MNLTRNSFLKHIMYNALGVAVLPHMAQADTSKKSAEYFIQVTLSGGLSHVDSFDLKDREDVKSKFAKINTKVDSIKLCEHLSGLAKHAEKMAVFNGVSSKNGAHEQARYYNSTSYTKIGSIIHPVIPSWVSYFKDDHKLHAIPQSIVVNSDANYPFAGWLGPKYSPVPIQDPLKGLQDSVIKNPTEFGKRIAILNELNRTTNNIPNAAIKDYVDFYAQTIKLLSSKDLEVFDITKEKADTKEKFGNNRTGQGFLLLKRLLEKGGIKSGEIVIGGFDNHQNIYTTLDTLLNTVDKGLTALIDELTTLGIMNKTLIAITTDFGRTPTYRQGSTVIPLNVNSGRDHFPAAFSNVLIGGNIKAGVYGKTDELGEKVVDGEVHPNDINATIAAAMGLDGAMKVISSEGRPFTMGNSGIPVLNCLL